MTTDKQPKPKAKAAPKQPSAPSQAPVVDKPKQARSNSARKNFNTSGDTDALAKIIETDYI